MKSEDAKRSKRAKRELAKAQAKVVRGGDEAQLSAPTAVTKTQAARSVQGNTTEDAADDRRSQAIYDPYAGNAKRPDTNDPSSPPAHLDLKG